MTQDELVGSSFPPQAQEEVLARIEKMDDDALAMAVFRTREIEANATTLRHMHENAMLMRLELKGAKATATQRFKIQAVSALGRPRVPYPDKLREALLGKVPDNELDRAVRLEQPEPFWKADITRLKKLFDYGTEIQELIEGAIEREPSSRVDLLIEPLSFAQNVSPKALTDQK